MSPESFSGLYVHVPFCTAICNYCNFNRGLFDESLKRRYVEAVLTEIRTAVCGLRADTLYFGGGTPSLLAPDDLGRVIAAAREGFALPDTAEITMEANPESVDRERLDGFRAAGVTRLSFGVQSFSDEQLRRLDRLHTAARAEEVVRTARDAGFENLSLDLMMWLPEQTTSDWLESIARATALEPEHISLYMLEVYPHLPLRAAMNRHGWSQQPDDVAADMYEEAMQTLESAGYEQYEISNVAKPGRQSRHNLKYWTDGEWLGFGPGAHSTKSGSRWKNVSSTEDYVRRLETGRPVVAEHHRLDAEERLGDALFTGLRLNEGVNVSILSQRYGTDVWKKYGERLAPHLEAGLITKDGDCMKLTRQGMLLAHEVMAVFV